MAGRGAGATVADAPENPVVVGRITKVHGVCGWVKVQSFTEPEKNIFGYSPWWVRREGRWQKLEVDGHRTAAKGWQCHLKDIDDRDVARSFCQQDIAVAESCLPELEEGEYYWHQLEGLQVFCNQQGQQVSLGRVTSILATGANDVLVVKGTAESIERRERLIPYSDQVILDIDLGAERIEVDWDPEF